MSLFALMSSLSPFDNLVWSRDPVFPAIFAACLPVWLRIPCREGQWREESLYVVTY